MNNENIITYEGCSSISNSFKKCGITVEQASKNAIYFSQMIPKIADDNICLLQQNNRLTRRDRVELIRKLRKMKKT